MSWGITMTCWGTRRWGRLTGIPNGVYLPLRGNFCLDDLRLRAQPLGVDQMSALCGLCAHFLDVLLDVGALSEVCAVRLTKMDLASWCKASLEIRLSSSIAPGLNPERGSISPRHMVARPGLSRFSSICPDRLGRRDAASLQSQARRGGRSRAQTWVALK